MTCEEFDLIRRSTNPMDVGPEIRKAMTMHAVGCPACMESVNRGAERQRQAMTQEERDRFDRACMAIVFRDLVEEG